MEKTKMKSKSKSKLSKLIGSGSDTDAESEHELSHYINDRVKLMKEVLKIIKPKKMNSMAPDCMKNMDMQEINSMLLEELLGISNKRLKYIFEGKTLEEESSTDEEQPTDVISLDDVSDDDFVVISDDEADKHKHSKHKRKKIKEEKSNRKIKKEKTDNEKAKHIEKVKNKINDGGKLDAKDKEAIGEDNLMSVLELLELQARARAIRSQLELENIRKQKEQEKLKEMIKNNEPNEGDDDEVIMEIPQEVEIVITSSSDSETEETPAKNVVKVTEEEAKVESTVLESTNCSENQPEVTEVQRNTDSDNSSSSSNDNLQVIKERELKKQTNSNRVDIEQQTVKQQSKIDEAVEEFMKTQPPVEDTQKELEEQQKKNVVEEEDKLRKDKEKRLEKIKSKLQSFKQDIAVDIDSEGVSLNVLENVVLKAKNQEESDADSNEKELEHSDDLVINVDQDEIDCMIID